MRLVAWNANYNNRRRSFEQDVTLLAPLCADILVISETAAPPTNSSLGAFWIGGASGPGLAVVAQNGWQLVPHQTILVSPMLAGGFTAAGPATVNLLVVWPVKQGHWTSYHKILMSVLNSYKSFLGSGRAVMAGDLNSSTRVATQKQTHPTFVHGASRLGLVSAYHECTGEYHGQESKATYLRERKNGAAREFHVDYCFVPQTWKGNFRADVLTGSPWDGYSDHRPVVLDLDKGAI